MVDVVERDPIGSVHDSTSALSLVYLNLLDAVDDEHVLQVLHGSVHPVVEGSSPLGKLQIQLIDGLPQLLHTLPEQKAFTLYGHIIIIIFFFFSPPPSYLQGISPLLGESPQVVPLVTDALAAGVDRSSIVVVQLTADRGMSLTKEYLISLIFYSAPHV